MPNNTPRFIAVHRLENEQLDKLIDDLKAKSITVVERLDGIKTLVVTGDLEAILQLQQTMPNIISVEPDGIVRVPE
jgi:malonyl CoA-acyl carrier protein transacylase